MRKEKSIIEMLSISTNRLRTVIIEWTNTLGIKRRWEAVRRVMKNQSINIGSFDDIVVVVPITDEGKMIFISQLRATVAAVRAGNEERIDESKYQVIEFPAGVVDSAGLSKKETAMLELMEEAKYGARNLIVINEGTISAGMSFEYVTEYLATGLHPVLGVKGDEQSKITVYEVPLTEAKEWIEKKRLEGFIIDSRIKPLISLVKEYYRGE